MEAFSVLPGAPDSGGHTGQTFAPKSVWDMGGIAGWPAPSLYWGAGPGRAFAGPRDGGPCHLGYYPLPVSMELPWEDWQWRVQAINVDCFRGNPHKFETVPT